MNYNKREIFNMFKNTPLYKGMDFSEEENYKIFSALKNFENDFFCSNGASKLVFIPKDTSKDFVIKIPYSGMYHTIFEDDGRIRESYCRYKKAGNKERPWDYCLTEVLRYKTAVSHGLGRCFARTEYFGAINGYPIYIQEKCDVFRHTNNISHTKKAHNTTLKASGELDFDGFIDIDWLTDFRLYYGSVMLRRFTKFIINNGWEDDLRIDNIGYINNRPVLIDYSSFLD